MSHIQACLAQLFAQQSLSLAQSCEFFTEVAAGNVDPDRAFCRFSGA